MADGSVSKRIKTLSIELYTDEKDPDLEATVEAALDAAGLCYNSDDNRIDAEHMYEVIWSMEVMMDPPEAQTPI